MTKSNLTKIFPLNKTKIPGLPLIKFIILFALWFFVYKKLFFISNFITYKILNIPKNTHSGEAISFFLYDVPKIFMLLSLIIFLVGIVNTFFTPNKTRKILAGKYGKFGNVPAALLGIVTPFCSCSAIPLFLGFISAGIPLGVTFSFLIAAPMVNEVALVLLYGLFGIKVAAIYLFTGLIIAITAGWIIGILKMEKYLQDWVKNVQSQKPENIEEQLSWNDRIETAKITLKDILKRIWIYIIIGILIGAIIHGFVPEGIMASIIGKNNRWAVPAAILIGIPMYSNAAGIIPIIQALMAKGAALGTVLAFMMSVIALSLPEMMILKKVLKFQLIIAFVLIVGTGILFVGYLFNFIL